MLMTLMSFYAVDEVADDERVNEEVDELVDWSV